MTNEQLLLENFRLGEQAARLLKEVVQLRQENERLRQENEELRNATKGLGERLELVEREQKRQAAPFRRREQLKVNPKQQKKRGRKPGHPGAFRQPPKEFDETIIVTLDKCPHCTGEVEPQQMRTQYIQEIPQIKPHVTRLVTWSGWCAQCGKVHSTHPLQTSLGQGAAGTHLGPRAQGLAVLLARHYGVPMRKVCKILRDGFGLSLTSGGLSQLLDRVANKLQGQYDELIERVRQSDVVYADETSWYVGAAGYWLWVFTTPTSTIYRIASSRGHPVAAKVLGEDFAGVLVTDCANCYDQFKCRKHKCIFHHLHALKKQRQQPQMKDPSYLDAWEQLWTDVLELTKQRDQLAAADFAARTTAIEVRADALLAQETPQIGDRKFHTRMKKNRPHLFGCLHYNVDATNNRAERAIRPAVVARKISCGNKTERGSKTTEILISLLATAQQTGRDFLGQLSAALSPTVTAVMPAG